MNQEERAAARARNKKFAGRKLTVEWLESGTGLEVHFGKDFTEAEIPEVNEALLDTFKHFVYGYEDA